MSPWQRRSIGVRPCPCSSAIASWTTGDRRFGWLRPRFPGSKPPESQLSVQVFLVRAAHGGNGTESPGLEVLHRLDDLGPGVHDERTGHDDAFTNRLAAEHEHLEGVGAR